MKWKYIKPIILSLLVVAFPVQAAPANLALVVFKKGNVSVLRQGKAKPARIRDLIQKEDEIRTGPGSEVSLQLSTGVLVKVSANTSLKVVDIARSEKEIGLALRLEKGTLLGKASKESGRKLHMTVQSPTAVASVRGTEFIVDVTEEQSTVLVDEGVVNVSDPAGKRSVDCEAGNKVVSDGKELIEGIMDGYEKQRFAIFERFEKEKMKNFEAVVEQIRRNRELIEQQRQKLP